MSNRVVALLTAAFFGLWASGQDQGDLPDGKSADLVRARCLTCHRADLISQQRLSRVGWDRELDKMVRWGATVSSDDERRLMVDYLAANFGPAAAVTAADDGGREIFVQRCLGCHGTDIVEQQRLSREGWVREIDKMVRWGANVDPAQKDRLAIFLTREYGLR